MDVRDRLTIELPGPIDVPASLATIGRWGDDGIDRWDGQRLLRTVRVTPDSVVGYAARVSGGIDEPRLVVEIERPLTAAASEAAVAAIVATLVPDGVQAAALRRLATEDPVIARLAARYLGLVAVQFPDPLSALIRSISAQQVNLRWAAEVRRRLAERYGRQHEVGGDHVFSLDATALAGATIAQLRQIQLTTAKAISIVACATAAAEGRLQREDLEGLDDDELIERLVGLRGIGRWSAEWFLARTLGRPRVVAGDLGVRKAVGRLYADGSLPSEADVRRLTAHWGAAASLAQALALHDLAESPPPPAPRVSRPAQPPRIRAG